MADLSIIAKLSDEASPGLTKISDGLKGVENAASTAAASGFKNLQAVGTVALGAIAAGAAAAAAAVGVLAVNGVKAAIDFEKGMSEVFTLLPGISQSAMDEMGSQVLQLSQDFGVLPDDVVPALYQALSAGVPPDNVFSFLETASMAAIGGVTDLETAVDGITSVMNAYGSEVLTAAQASDVMFTAVRLGKTDFGQLSSSLFNVIPTAASLGVSFEDVAASLAVMTAQGVPTSVATTQLRQAFIEASKGGTLLSDAIKDLTGQSFTELIAQGMSSTEIFQQLRESMPEQEFKDLFGSVEALNAVLATTGPNFETTIAALEEMRASAGATETAFGTVSQTLQFTIDRLKAFGASILIEIGNSLEPLLSVLLALAMSALPAIQAAFDVVKPTIEGVATAIGNFVTQLSNGIDPLTAVKGVIVNLATIFGVSATAANSVANAIHIMLIRAGEMIAPIVQAVTSFVSWKDVLIALGLAVASVVIPAIIGIIAVLAPIIATIAAVIAVVALLRNAWETDFAGIRDFVAGVWAAIQQTFAAFVALFQGDFAGFLTGIQGAWETGWNALVAFLGNIWGMVQPKLLELWTSISTWFQSVDWAGLALTGVAMIADGFTNLWTWIQPKLLELWTEIQGWFQSVDWAGLALTAVNLLLEGFNQLGELVGTAVGNMYIAITEWISSQDWNQIGVMVMEFIGTAISGAVALLVTAVLAIYEFIKGAAEEHDWPEIGLNIVTAIVDALTSFIEGVGSVLAEWYAAFVDWVGSVDWASVGQSIVDFVIASLETFASFAGETLAGWAQAFFDWVAGVDWQGIGQTIVTAVIDALATFAATVGSTLADWLAAFTDWVNTQDWEQIGYDIVTFIIDALKFFVNDVPATLAEWYQSVFDYLKGVDWEAVGLWVVENVILGLVKFALMVGTTISEWYTAMKDKLQGQDWGALGQSIIDGVKSGLTGAAGGLMGAIKDAATGAWNAFAGAIGFGSPAKAFMPLGESVSQGLAVGIADSMGQVVSAISTVASKTKMTGVKEFADAAKAIVETVRSAMQAIALLKEYTAPSGDVVGKMIDFSQNIAALVNVFADVAGNVSSKGMAHAKEFADAAKTVVDLFSPAVNMLAALAEYTRPAQPMLGKMQDFSHLITIFTQVFGEFAKRLSADGIAHAKAFADASKTLVDLFEPAVKVLADLAEYVRPAQPMLGKMQDFSHLITIFVQVFADFSARLSADGVKHAKSFAAAAKAVIDLFEPGVKTLTALAEYVRPAQPMLTQMQDFSHLITIFVQVFGEFAQRLSKDGLAHAKEFADAAKGVLDLVEPAIDTLAALANFVAPMADVEANLNALAAHIKLIVEKIAEIAVSFEQTAVDAAADFAAAAKKVLDLVKPGIDAIIALAEYTAASDPATRAAAFAADLTVTATILVTAFVSAAASIGEDALDAAVQFAGSVAKVAKETADAMGSLNDIAQSETPDLSKQVDYLLDQMPMLADALTKTQATLNNNVVGAADDFRKNTLLILEHVTEALDHLHALINSDVPGSLQRILDDLIAMLKSTVTPGFNAGHDIGAAIGDGIAAGINSKLAKIKKAAEDAAKAALAAAEAELGISSPSKVAAARIGVPWVEGIAVGMRKIAPIERAIGGLASTLIRPLDARLNIAAAASAGRFAAAGAAGGGERTIIIERLELPNVTDVPSFLDELEAYTS